MRAAILMASIRVKSMRLVMRSPPSSRAVDDQGQIEPCWKNWKRSTGARGRDSWRTAISRRRGTRDPGPSQNTGSSLHMKHFLLSSCAAARHALLVIITAVLFTWRAGAVFNSIFNCAMGPLAVMSAEAAPVHRFHRTMLQSDIEDLQPVQCSQIDSLHAAANSQVTLKQPPVFHKLEAQMAGSMGTLEF